MSTGTLGSSVTPTPVFLGLIDHSVSNYADFNTGATLHDSTPGIVFTSEVGDTYTIYDNGTMIGTMVATSTNTNWTVPSTLFNGAHALSVYATNASGQTSAAMNVNMTIAAGPAAPTYLGMVDHTISNYAEANIHTPTTDSSPSIVLTGHAGDTLNVFDGGKLFETITMTDSNMLVNLPNLTNGVHNLTFTETNAAGTSVPTFLTVTVDAPVAALQATVAPVVPPTPVFLGLIDHSVSNYADFNTGATLHDSTPGIVFTSEVGDTYTIYDNGTMIGTMVATSTNTNWTVPSTLFNGAHALSVYATNASGQTSAAMNVNMTIAAGPAAPTYLGMVDHTISNYAEANIHTPTTDSSPSIVLTGHAGDTLNVFDGGKLFETITMTDSNMLVNLPNLTNGVHNLTFTETNAAGTSVPTFLTVTVDAPVAALQATVAPVVPPTPVFLGLIDHSVSNYADFNTGATLHDSTPGIVFTSEVGDTYTIYDNGTMIGTMVATSTNTNWTVPSTLFNGAHALSVYATNASGQTSAAMNVNMTIAAGPAAPTYLGMVDHTISNYAEANIHTPTTDSSPSIVLTGHAGDTLNVFDGGKLFETITMTDSNMLVNLPNLTNGVHNLTFTETNAAGTSVPTFLTVTVDAPVAALQAVSVSSADSSVVVVGLHDAFVANAAHASVDLGVDPAAYFKQSTAHIEGGQTGTHTLHLTGSHEVLDLTSLSGKTAAAKVSGIQAIDLGGHANSLNLSIVDVLNLGHTDLFRNDGDQQLMVNGAMGDTVNVLHASVAGVQDSNWSTHGTASVGGVMYNVYEHTGAHTELLVQQGVQVVMH